MVACTALPQHLLRPLCLCVHFCSLGSADIELQFLKCFIVRGNNYHRLLVIIWKLFTVYEKTKLSCRLRREGEIH
ncbi:unnamed protein product [Allacma fusca]|uniref:Uncharacterized protein n=1 Tax=Allacma fusca TaxID=39272 RepID=A0A8J2JFE7_9HEXA|nr:unnamed protein product [Allacma fusca]